MPVWFDCDVIGYVVWYELSPRTLVFREIALMATTQNWAVKILLK